MNKPKREKKPKQLRAAEKAHDAGIYVEGYKHVYLMGKESFFHLWRRYESNGLGTVEVLSRIQEELRKPLE